MVKFYFAELCLTINAGYNPSLEIVAVNSHLAGLLEEDEHQPPTKVRHPQRGFGLPRHQRHVRDRKNIRKNCVPQPCQSGCRKEPKPQPIYIQARGNCVNALLSIQYHVYRHLDNSECKAVRLFTMDFSKAFDSVNHSKLSAKRKQLPLNRIPLIGAIASCLQRQQRIFYNNDFYNWKVVNKGTTQGSVSGPYLFNTFLNGLEISYNKAPALSKYADDSTMVSPVSNQCDPSANLVGQFMT